MPCWYDEFLNDKTFEKLFGTIKGPAAIMTRSTCTVSNPRGRAVEIAPRSGSSR